MTKQRESFIPQRDYRELIRHNPSSSVKKLAKVWRGYFPSASISSFSSHNTQLLRVMLGLDRVQKPEVLVFLPHNDDYDAGALVYTLSKRLNAQITLVHLTDGKAGRGNLDDNITEKKVIEIREKESLEGNELLGVAKTLFCRFDDGTLAFADKKETKKHDIVPHRQAVIAGLIRALKPDLIITHDLHNTYDPHPDHKAVGKIVEDAVLVAGNEITPKNLVSTISSILGNKKISTTSHKVKNIIGSRPHEPNTIILFDKDEHKAKVNAYRKHKSQFGEGEKFKEKENNLFIIGKLMGIIAGKGKNMGEAFWIQKTIFG